MAQLTEIDYACNYKIIILSGYGSNEYVPCRVFSVFSLLNLCCARVAGLSFSWVFSGCLGRSGTEEAGDGLPGRFWRSFPCRSFLLGVIRSPWKACNLGKGCRVVPVAFSSSLPPGYRVVALACYAAGGRVAGWFRLPSLLPFLLGIVWSPWYVMQQGDGLPVGVSMLERVSPVWSCMQKPVAVRPVSCLPASHGSEGCFSC